MKKTLLIVLFKEDVYSSKSIQSFLKIKPLEAKLILWDNSPKQLPQNQIEYLRENIDSVSYVHTPQNMSLSKIYNKVWDDNLDSELLYIFDQDSDFTYDYFEKSIRAFAENEDIGLFIPYVKVVDKIVSPGYFKNYKGCYFDELAIGRLKAQNKLAIASGMVIAIARVGELRFDENLSFYGIDSKFTLDYSKKCDFIFVLDYCLTHELSQFIKEDYKKTYNRFKSYRKSSLYIQYSQGMYFWFLFLICVWCIKSMQAYIKYRLRW